MYPSIISICNEDKVLEVFFILVPSLQNLVCSPQLTSPVILVLQARSHCGWWHRVASASVPEVRAARGQHTLSVMSPQNRMSHMIRNEVLKHGRNFGERLILC